MRLPLKVLLGSATLVIATFPPATPAAATEYPWCAEYSLPGGAINCGFVSYQQCRATVFGVGGTCRPNLFYAGPPAPPPGRRYR
jgi:uncharacterized protein DUF3551